MQDHVPGILELLINWFPMLILIGVWIFFMRRFKSKSGMTGFDYQELMLKEQQRHNEVLEKILARLEQR